MASSTSPETWATYEEVVAVYEEVVRELRPRQVLAARMLIEGRLGKDVAAAIGVSPETVSRWKAQPEFQEFTRLLLQDSVDAARLGLVALTGEAIGQLHNLLNSFSDAISLKACALVLGKAAPIIGVIGEELRRPQRGHS